MAEVQIPDYIDDQLNELAATTGQSKDDLILEPLHIVSTFSRKIAACPLANSLPPSLSAWIAALNNSGEANSSPAKK